MFPTAEEINAWNDRVDADLSDINTAKSVAVGITTTLIPVAKFGPLGNRALAVIAAGVDNKLLSISAKEGGLKSGDALVLTITTTVIRSTSEGDEKNGVRIVCTVNIEDSSGNVVEKMQHVEDFMNVVAFQNGIYGQAAKSILERYESSEGSITEVLPSKSLPYLIKFKHRD
ncbi:MAG: hypothetical protein AB8E82_19090 [Aureispira sp.]